MKRTPWIFPADTVGPVMSELAAQDAVFTLTTLDRMRVIWTSTEQGSFICDSAQALMQVIPEFTGVLKNPQDREED